MTSDVQRWLRDEDREIAELIDKIQIRVDDDYDGGKNCVDLCTVQAVLDNVYQLREIVARTRALLEKHEWDGQNTDEMGEPTGTRYCLECFRNKSDGHTPDCAIAAEIKDLPRKI